MDKRTRWTTKALTLLMCGAVVFMGFTTACTPAENNTGAKGDTPYTAPDKLTEVAENEDGKYTVHFDAKINTPENSVFPVYKVELAQRFTQEQLDKVKKALVGDVQLYTYNLNDIMEFKPDGSYISHELTEDKISVVDSLKADDDGSNIYMVDPDNPETARMQVRYIKENSNEYHGVLYTNKHELAYSAETLPESDAPKPGIENTTEQQAITEANKLLDQMGLGGYVHTATQLVEYGGLDKSNNYNMTDSRYAYEMVFEKDFGGVNAQGQEDPFLWDSCQDGECPYNREKEYVQVMYSDEGLIMFALANPYGKAEELEQNATLKPFEEIKEIATKELMTPDPMYDADDYELLKQKAEVWEMRLEHAQLIDENSAGYIAPVWKLYGITRTHEKIYFDDMGWVDQGEERLNQELGQDDIEMIMRHPMMVIDAVDGKVLEHNPT